MCIATRRVKVFSTNKPWFTLGLRSKLKTREKAFKSGGHAAYKKAKYDVRRTIRGAKINYRKKQEDKILTGDARAVWQGLQSISSCKRKSSAAPDDDPRLADKLDSFYARASQLHFPATPHFRSPSLWRSVKSGDCLGNKTAARLLALMVRLSPPRRTVLTSWPCLHRNLQLLTPSSQCPRSQSRPLSTTTDQWPSCRW